MAERMSDAAALMARAGLTKEQVRQLARETGVVRRWSPKFAAHEFVCLLMALAVKGTVSYNDLAASFDADAQISISRQAIGARMTEHCVLFVQRLLGMALRASGGEAEAMRRCREGGFTRVLVQDSTLIKVPTALAARCSGVRNGHATTAHVRVQVIYDLVSATFVDFAIDPYTRNDLQAGDLLRAQPGDLVLRDRGYLSADNLQAVVGAGGHVISRYKHRLALYDATTGDPLSLLALLRQHGTLDRLVRLRPDHAPLRLVAVPIDEETANRRRQHLRRDTKGHHPSAELLELCNWAIIFTTLTDPAITAAHLLALYGLRWRIESTFKAWKSHLAFAKLHQVSHRQLIILLTVRLLFATLLMVGLVPRLSAHLNQAGKGLSMLKLTRYIVTHLEQLPALLRPHVPAHRLTAITRYCAYDQRRRRHYEQAYTDILTTITSLNLSLA